MDQETRNNIKDPVWFAHNIIRYKGKPLELHDWQIRFCRETNFLTDRIVLRAARQVGKSLLVSFLAAFYCATVSHTTVFIFSRSWEQAGNIFGYVRRMFDESPELRKLLEHNRKHEILLTNGSRIQHRTAGIDGQGCLGFSCENNGSVILDECAYVRAEAAQNILPIARNAGLVLVSTPHRPHTFFQACCESDDFKRYHVPAMQSPLYSREHLERDKRILPAHKFRTDCLAEFAVGGSEAVFSTEAVESAVDPDLPLFDPHGLLPVGDRDRNYVWSLDPSRLKNDLCVFAVGEYDLRENAISVVAYHVFAPKNQADSQYAPVATFCDDPDQVIEIIGRYGSRFHPVTFYIDSSNDTYYAREFAKKLYPVNELNWSDSNKERYIEHLSACFNAGRIRIPNDFVLLDQLLSYSYDLEQRKDGSERKRYMSGADDFVDCLAQLSLHCTVTGVKEWEDFIECV